jgi:hypothetical protein
MGGFMNLFSQCGGTNICLWILIILLIAASSTSGGLENVLSGSCTPILIALIYSMWRNGTLSSLFCGNNNGGGCGCN